MVSGRFSVFSFFFMTHSFVPTVSSFESTVTDISLVSKTLSRSPFPVFLSFLCSLSLSFFLHFFSYSLSFHRLAHTSIH